MAEDLAALAKSPLFAGFDEAQLQSFAALMRRERHGANSLLFVEGAEGDGLYVILAGRVRIEKQVPNALAVPFIELGPGRVFGEMSLISGAPRSATCTVVEDSDVLVLSRQRLSDIKLTDPMIYLQLIENITRVVSDHLRLATARLTALLEEHVRAEREHSDLEALLQQSKQEMVAMITPPMGIKRPR